MISKGNGRIGVASFRADQPNLYHGTLCQTKAYWNHREDIGSIGNRSSKADLYRARGEISFFFLPEDFYENVRDAQGV